MIECVEEMIEIDLPFMIIFSFSLRCISKEKCCDKDVTYSNSLDMSLTLLWRCVIGQNIWCNVCSLKMPLLKTLEDVCEPKSSTIMRHIAYFIGRIRLSISHVW